MKSPSFFQVQLGPTLPKDPEERHHHLQRPGFHGHGVCQAAGGPQAGQAEVDLSAAAPFGFAARKGEKGERPGKFLEFLMIRSWFFLFPILLQRFCIYFI